MNQAVQALFEMEPVDHNPPPGITVEIDETAFWKSRPDLTQLRDFARASRVSPWAMLGSVLARTACSIPPAVVLPPLRGGYGSLNLFVAIVAPSGKGKGASERAAERFLLTDPEVYVANPGSGEGLAKEYAEKIKPKGEPSTQIDHRNSVLFSVAEIDTLAALKNRSGSTLMAELRKAFSGESLGFSYSGEDKKVVIRPHRYRAAMVAGVQPGRSETLFEDADGGTPQRFLWFPTTDPGRPSTPPDLASVPKLALNGWTERPLVTEATKNPEALRKLRIADPVEESTLWILELPDEIAVAVDSEANLALDGIETDELDSHGLLVRIKVAAVLMWLRGERRVVSDQDWELAGVIKAVSDRTRDATQARLHQEAAKRNREQGKSLGRRQSAAQEVVESDALQRTTDLVRKHVSKAGGAALRRKELKTKLHTSTRDYLDAAVEKLADAGVVVVERTAVGTDNESYTVAWREGA